MATLRDAVQCLMLTVAILAAFSCISRPDYNFPLYLYLWWVFFYVPEHKKVRYTSSVSKFTSKGANVSYRNVFNSTTLPGCVYIYIYILNWHNVKFRCLCQSRFPLPNQSRHVCFGWMCSRACDRRGNGGLCCFTWCCHAFKTSSFCFTGVSSVLLSARLHLA